MDMLRIYPDKPNERHVEQVVAQLQAGGVVIYPTDTIYAIGCDALNVKAVERVCKLKGINPQKANLSIICNDLSNISNYAKVNNYYFKLMKKNLPGAFTFILPTTSELPRIYKNRKTVGIRVPDNNIVRRMVELLGNPLLTTSVEAESDQVEYLVDPELIAENYEHHVDLVVDGGYGSYNGSTVVDCTSDTPEIIRQGLGELLL